MIERLFGSCIPALTAEIKKSDTTNTGIVAIDDFKSAFEAASSKSRTALDKKMVVDFITKHSTSDGKINYFALLDAVGKSLEEDDKRLAEVLNLLTGKCDKNKIHKLRMALAKLAPKQSCQSILKRTGGKMSPEEFAKSFTNASKEARSTEAILAAENESKESKNVGGDIKAAICPSVLSSDFAKLGSECQEMIKLGADWLHMDVMDGHFVPNLTIGAPVIAAVRKYTKACLDCHLMVSNPAQWLPDFAKAGADTFTFHLEAVEDPGKMIDMILEKGMKPGIALKPDTPAEDVFPFCDKLNHVLVMTVEPGFGGQSFMWWTMPKVAKIRLKFPSIGIQVDGGVKTHTIDACARAGANLIVSGSGIFKAEKPGDVISIMRKSVDSVN